ncbi:MAG TPA: bifunctional hydroxymethylpyrimidine kinase/phosphomethylpyrimidine kinase, partial [Methanomassiliicoccales archaeon]|nr:bifunctional hydroxymethylpyrimidine kinase/phosphomethylpyrimidine kinase [Methanomassiliicoccales archaeon]
MKTVLTIAGSDSIGGAGIEADLKAIACHDLHGAVALTAITSQNTMRVSEIVPLKASAVISQIDAVLDDADVRAIKTGMLYSGDIAGKVADRLAGENIPLVVDPVMVAGVGDSLYSDSLIDVFREKVLPITKIVTPNRQEAELLSSITISDIADAERACRAIARCGPEAVLLKGGHFKGGTVVDLLYHRGRFMLFEGPRLKHKVHGGGCTVSSYLACCLAKNMSVKKAVLDSKMRILDAIALSYQAGQGIRVVNPLASKQKEAMRADHIDELRWAIGMLER